MVLDGVARPFAGNLRLLDHLHEVAPVLVIEQWRKTTREPKLGIVFVDLLDAFEGAVMQRYYGFVVLHRRLQSQPGRRWLAEPGRHLRKIVLCFYTGSGVVQVSSCSTKCRTCGYLMRTQRVAPGRFARTITLRCDEAGDNLWRRAYERWSLPGNCYLPMQNRLKITPSRSSELNSPVIEFS